LVYQYINLALSKIDFPTLTINTKLGKDMSEVIENTTTIAIASRWSRFWAFIIDAFVYAIFIIPVFLYSSLYDKFLLNESIDLAEKVALIVYGWVVFFVCQGYLLHKRGQTIGKNLMDIAIVDMEGNQIGLLNIVGKRIIPMVAVAYIPFIGRFISMVLKLSLFQIKVQIPTRLKPVHTQPKLSLHLDGLVF
jgi:uncharacterized RDD family membrane protein YckC